MVLKDVLVSAATNCLDCILPHIYCRTSFACVNKFPIITTGDIHVWTIHLVWQLIAEHHSMVLYYMLSRRNIIYLISFSFHFKYWNLSYQISMVNLSLATVSFSNNQTIGWVWLKYHNDNVLYSNQIFSVHGSSKTTISVFYWKTPLYLNIF